MSGNLSQSVVVAPEPAVGEPAAVPAPPSAAGDSPLAYWLRHIESVHWRSIDLTLDRPRRVMHLLRVPPPPHAVVVAGTNGKGSSVAMLESILRTAGRRVGAYTSPHLVRYNERVRIDGREVADGDLVAAFEAVEAARRGIPLTYFEFGTLAALWLFHRHGVEIAVLEVGMGGRLDAVNLVDGDVALLTSIGIDHEQWLGRGRERIAAEKCGILRHDRPVVCSDPRPPAEVARQARRRSARLLCLGAEFSVRGDRRDWSWSGPFRPAADGRIVLRGLPAPDSPAPEQIHNAAGVLAVIGVLGRRFRIGGDEIRAGLGAARMPGRLQRLEVGDGVEVLLDVGHNPEAVAVLARHLRAHPLPGRTTAVFAMLGDKDVSGAVASLTDLIDHWYVATLNDDRAVPARVLAERIAAAGPRGAIEACGDVGVAFGGALAGSRRGDRIVVFGSFHTVGAVFRLVERSESVDGR